MTIPEAHDGRMPYQHRGGTPKPPPEIWAEMVAAGTTGDDVRLGLAKSRYRAWLNDNGYQETR